MFQCKRRRNRGNSGGKAGHFLIFLLLFSIFIEVFMEIPFCSTEIFGAELINSAQEGKTQVLSGSLAVFEEIELTPQEVLKAQKEIEKSFSARRSAPSARETDEWKKYASTYYYEKLSKAQKIFWDTLDEQCSIFLGGQVMRRQITVPFGFPLSHTKISPMNRPSRYTRCSAIPIPSITFSAILFVKMRRNAFFSLESYQISQKGASGQPQMQK